MPRPFKKSAQAKSQRQSGLSVFESVSYSSDEGSEYIQSEGDDDVSSDEENCILQSISEMKNLYAKYLPAHFKSGGTEGASWVSILLTGFRQEINE